MVDLCIAKEVNFKLTELHVIQCFIDFKMFNVIFNLPDINNGAYKNFVQKTNFIKTLHVQLFNKGHNLAKAT